MDTAALDTGKSIELERNAASCAALTSHFGMAGTHGLARACVLCPKLWPLTAQSLYRGRVSAFGFRGNHLGNRRLGNHALSVLIGC